MSQYKKMSFSEPQSGVRESKRRNTYQRIIDTSIGLFLEQGYEATTLDAIASAAGISRRTFFAYFKTKDEILRTWQLYGWDEFLEDLSQASPDELPVQAIRGAFSKRLSYYETQQLQSLANIMSSSQALQATKYAAYAEQERRLYQRLCEVWRQPERRLALRLLAMSTVGAIRVAVEIWEQPENQRPLADIFNQVMERLSAPI